MPGVTAPLFIIETELDEMLTLESGVKVRTKTSSSDIDYLLLKESKHQVFNGTEREKVARAITSWLEKT